MNKVLSSSQTKESMTRFYISAASLLMLEEKDYELIYIDEFSIGIDLIMSTGRHQKEK